MRWAVHVAGIRGEKRVCTGLWWGDLRGRCHLEELGVDRRILLKRILRKSVGLAWTGIIWLRIATSCGLV
jgi:hypothetical protein